MTSVDQVTSSLIQFLASIILCVFFVGNMLMFEDAQVWGVLADRYCKLTMLMYAFLGRAYESKQNDRCVTCAPAHKTIPKQPLDPKTLKHEGFRPQEYGL